MPEQITLEVDGFGPVRFCHATPRNDEEVVLVDGRLIVNPGSVGLPYGRLGAHWAILSDGTVSTGRTVIDPEILVNEVVAGSKLPGVARWAEENLRHPASDVEAIGTFGPRDGR